MARRMQHTGVYGARAPGREAPYTTENQRRFAGEKDEDDEGREKEEEEDVFWLVCRPCAFTLLGSVVCCVRATMAIPCRLTAYCGAKTSVRKSEEEKRAGADGEEDRQQGVAGKLIQIYCLSKKERKNE